MNYNTETAWSQLYYTNLWFDAVISVLPATGTIYHVTVVNCRPCLLTFPHKKLVILFGSKNLWWVLVSSLWNAFVLYLCGKIVKPFFSVFFFLPLIPGSYHWDAKLFCHYDRMILQVNICSFIIFWSLALIFFPHHNSSMQVKVLNSKDYYLRKTPQLQVPALQKDFYPIPGIQMTSGKLSLHHRRLLTKWQKLTMVLLHAQNMCRRLRKMVLKVVKMSP